MGRATFMMALLCLLALLPAPAGAQSRVCVTDAELEAAVGDQVRAGAFAISTARLGDRQMCSQVPVAAAIQQLREK